MLAAMIDGGWMAKRCDRFELFRYEPGTRYDLFAWLKERSPEC